MDPADLPPDGFMPDRMEHKHSCDLCAQHVYPPKVFEVVGMDTDGKRVVFQLSHNTLRQIYERIKVEL